MRELDQPCRIRSARARHVREYGYRHLERSGILGMGSNRIQKKFQIAEGQQIEFRAEAFNVTNSVHLGNPATDFSSGNFGRILCSAPIASPTGCNPGAVISPSGGPRIMQFALKYV